MKTRFGTTDIVAIIKELKNQYLGMRVHQVYDVDSKTYLIKLNRYDEKVTLILESGVRVHTTEFEWPKNPTPSGFSMKLRKHIKNKRLENVSQLGSDRIIDFQFGINEASYHLILELYDRGNLVLADYEYTILNILRPRAPENDDVKFIVRERYPIEKARQPDPTFKELKLALQAAKPGESLRKILINNTVFGPALIAHIMLLGNFPKNCSVGKDFNFATDISTLMDCIYEADKILKEIAEKPSEGYVIQKEEVKDVKIGEKIVTNIEFHPFLFEQLKGLPYTTYVTFDKAVDTYFSTMESQKIDLKTHQKEKEALKKLENVKKDHEQRLLNLHKEQAEDEKKAQLIELNCDIVEKAITIIRSAVASQISWLDIWDLIQEAQAEGDPVAKSIKKLKLEINHFTIMLSDPFSNEENGIQPQLVDINLDLSAYGNARKYYDQKRHHAKKEQKTLEASEKAFKNAERKTKETLKEVAIISNIAKARKPMWFEKFIWCISSENYLIIAGRDIQQNEVLVKRYMKPGDIYVHADIHGASSVIIKNNTKDAEIPPKTLNEAGTLAVCYSAAWNAKIMSNAWWVYHHQVTKTAPTGEYLTTGSFMIRGKKNYLLPSHLILGFGFLFKLHDDSIERHRNERKIKYEESIDDSQVDEENIDLDSVSGESDNESNHVDANDQDDETLKADQNFNNEEENLTEAKEESSDEKEMIFPDTKVNFNIDKILDNKTSNAHENDKTTLIISAGFKNKAKKQNVKPTNKPQEEVNVDKDKMKPNGLKRGQRAKLKKIKEKYKDQDEEERELRMKILASAGVPKQDKKSKKKASKMQTQKTSIKDSTKIFRVIESNSVEKEEETSEIILPNQDEISPKDEDRNLQDQAGSEGDEDDEQEDLASDELNLLSSLTGFPLPEDGLLFCVPVCGPYSAMQNFKFKVKVIPGTGRRGKAAKTALNVFLHDKTISPIERDCLRSVKDQDISRNFPGKVKISHTYVKKKK